MRLFILPFAVFCALILAGCSTATIPADQPNDLARRFGTLAAVAEHCGFKDRAAALNREFVHLDAFHAARDASLSTLTAAPGVAAKVSCREVKMRADKVLLSPGRRAEPSRPAFETDPTTWRRVVSRLENGETRPPEETLFALAQLSNLALRCGFVEGWAELDGRFGQNAVYLFARDGASRTLAIPQTPENCRRTETVVELVKEANLSAQSLSYEPEPHTWVHCLLSRPRMSHFLSLRECRMEDGFVSPVALTWVGPEAADLNLEKSRTTHRTRRAMTLGELKLKVWLGRKGDRTIPPDRYLRRWKALLHQITLERRFRPT